MRPARVVVSALATAGVVLAAAACSGESDEPTGLETSAAPSETAAPTTTEDPDAAAVADIESLYQSYWDTIIAMENVQDEQASYAALQQVAIELIAQTQIANLRGLVDAGVTRDGEPVIGPPEVTVDGDTARAEGCVDEDGWNVYYNGEPVERELAGPQPRVFDLERVDGRWLITELVDQTEATITC